MKKPHWKAYALRFVLVLLAFALGGISSTEIISLTLSRKLVVS